VDSRTFEVFLQARGFEARGGFGEGDQDDPGLVGVLQPHQRG